MSMRAQFGASPFVTACSACYFDDGLPDFPEENQPRERGRKKSTFHSQLCLPPDRVVTAFLGRQDTGQCPEVGGCGPKKGAGAVQWRVHGQGWGLESGFRDDTESRAVGKA